MAGSFGLFFTLFLLFLRFLPVVAVAEVKAIMPQAHPHPEQEFIEDSYVEESERAMDADHAGESTQQEERE